MCSPDSGFDKVTMAAAWGLTDKGIGDPGNLSGCCGEVFGVCAWKEVEISGRFCLGGK